MSSDRLEHIPLTDILVEGRYRKNYGEIDDFVESVLEKGILQPITVVSLPNPKNGRAYKLVAGGRRYRAAGIAGLSTIPCLIRENTDALDSLEIELLENIERDDFHWSEQCRLIAAIDEHFRETQGRDWSARKTASRVSRSVGAVSQYLSLAKAMKAVPALEREETIGAALKKLKKIEEEVILKQLAGQTDAEVARRVEAAKGLPGTVSESTDSDSVPVTENQLDRRTQHYLHAEKHYRIGDAFEGLQQFHTLLQERGAPSVVTYIECDPPFGIALQEQKKRNARGDIALESYVEVAAEQYVEWLNKLAPLLYQCGADDCWLNFWYGPTWHAEVRTALESAGWKVDHIPAVWVKGESEESTGSGQTASPHTYLARATEFFFIARKGSPIMAKEGATNVFPAKPIPAKLKYHPTQKPQLLYEQLLNIFTFPNAVTLCPFLGSGVFLKTAYSLDRTGFGWELNERNKRRFLISMAEDFDLPDPREEEGSET